MSIERGSRIGPYEVTSPLGEGGMGVVYRAHDTKLQRDVALKLLPDNFSKDSERLSRFQREAQLLASLNHPNIAQIYGLEDVGGSGCIVMELVEGETLSERLKNGPLPIDEAIDVAKQVADALAAAHERGIVHRDLKPANIKVTPNGTVKVLDFGLAKAVAGKMSDSSLTSLPTSAGGSIAGTVLGTPGYMSPEQARGREVDARTDIWAFGCVFYEMLTARLAFEGETATDIMARIVTGQPDLNLLPPQTPPAIRMLLAATLNKNQQQRLQHIGDVRLFLDHNFFAGGEKSAAVAPRQSKRTTVLTAALCLALVVALIPAVLYFRKQTVDAPPMNLAFTVPGLVGNALTISPDGRRVAYLVQSDEGQRSIWVRPIGSEAGQKVAGTETPNAFFWSGDSRYIGFVSDAKLKKVDPSGGSPQVITDASGMRSFTWNRNGVILFQKDTLVYRVSDSGGEIKPVTALDESRKELAQGAPAFLPDGNHFLFAAASMVPENSGIFVGSLDSKTTTHVMSLNVQRISGMAYVPPGYLLYSVAGKMTANRFDGTKIQGDPVNIAEDTEGAFSVSDTGILTFRKAASADANNKQLTWVDREGRKLSEIGTPMNYGGIELSPNGDRLALDINSNGNVDIWVMDLTRAVPSRITFDPAQDWTSQWSPDGSRLAFGSAGRNKINFAQIYQKASSGVGTEELVTTDGAASIPVSWSPDNKYIVFSRTKSMGNDTWLLPLFGDKKAKPFLETPFDKIQAQVSPDSHWVAYTTNEAGAFQIVVQSFPEPTGGKLQISADGGVEPRWRHDGRELYYLSLDGKLMSVTIKADRTLEAGRPTMLFQTPLTVNRTRPDRNRRYDVSHDGQRFLIVTPAARESVTPITFLVNWTSLMK